MDKAIVGIDWGGTFVKIGVFDSKGRLISKYSYLSEPLTKPVDFFNFLSESIDNLRKKYSLEKAGIGIPGPVDTKKGFIYYLPNIKGWKDFPFKRMFQKKFKIPLFIDNDGNTSALAELRRGKAKGITDGIVFTLGTGLGCGLIIGGKVFRGRCSAAEAAHMPIVLKGEKCGCGGRGCVETLLGNSYFIRKVKSMPGYKKSSLSRVKNLDPYDIYQAAKEKDRFALKCWVYFGEVLGRFSSGLINLLNPELIIIGGGLSGAFPFFKQAMEKEISHQAMKPQSQQVKVVKSRLERDTGIIGACELALEK